MKQVSNTSILIVEPEPIVGEITAFRLELLGYKVRCVTSAEEAIADVDFDKVDLVITDLVLPKLDGLGLIERLSSDEKTSDLPIMVLSVNADLDRVQAVYHLGAVDFLVVPYHPEVLEEKVVDLLAKSKRETAGEVAVPAM